MKFNKIIILALIILSFNSVVFGQEELARSELWINVDDFNDTCSSKVTISYQISKNGFPIEISSTHTNDAYCDDLMNSYVKKLENEWKNHQICFKKVARYKKGIIFFNTIIYHFNIKP